MLRQTSNCRHTTLYGTQSDRVFPLRVIELKAVVRAKDSRKPLVIWLGVMLGHSDHFSHGVLISSRWLARSPRRTSLHGVRSKHRRKLGLCMVRVRREFPRKDRYPYSSLWLQGSPNCHCRDHLRVYGKHTSSCFLRSVTSCTSHFAFCSALGAPPGSPPWGLPGRCRWIPPFLLPSIGFASRLTARLTVPLSARGVRWLESIGKVTWRVPGQKISAGEAEPCG